MRKNYGPIVVEYYGAGAAIGDTPYYQVTAPGISYSKRISDRAFFFDKRLRRAIRKVKKRYEIMCEFEKLEFRLYRDKFGNIYSKDTPEYYYDEE